VTLHVVLLGLMGAGKTSIGRLVAARLGVAFVDGDDRLAEETLGRTAADVADGEGLDVLHAMEAEIALAALRSGEPCVIGPGASVCESAVVRDHMAGHVVVWLTAPVDHLAGKAVEKRHRPLVHDGDPRPLLARQLAVREPLVMALDPFVVDVSTTNEDGAADMIVAFVRDRSAAT
jgi:shikimate kinase/3-dehydroquinate synthase